MKKPTAMYSLSLTGKPASEPFSPPDYGDYDIEKLPNDLKHSLKLLMTKYGADVYLSLCLLDKAGQYGYMPYQEAKKSFDKAILPEILMVELSHETKLSRKLISAVCLLNDWDEKAVLDQIEREKLEMQGQGLSQVQNLKPQGRQNK